MNKVMSCHDDITAAQTLDKATLDELATCLAAQSSENEQCAELIAK